MPERRTVEYPSMQAILDDVRTISQDGPPRSSGGWSAAQNVHHVTLLIEDAVDGFPVKAPFPLGLLSPVVGPLLKKHIARSGFKAGRIKLPRGPFGDRYTPAPNTSWAQAFAGLERVIQRLADGQSMTQPSPLFGKMSHEDWVAVHTKHAQMHFGFLHPPLDDADDPQNPSDN